MLFKQINVSILGFEPTNRFKIVVPVIQRIAESIIYALE